MSQRQRKAATQPQQPTETTQTPKPQSQDSGAILTTINKALKEAKKSKKPKMVTGHTCSLAPRCDCHRRMRARIYWYKRRPYTLRPNYMWVDPQKVKINLNELEAHP